MDNLISSGGISEIGLAFFTALFGMVSILMKQVSDNRKEARDAKEAAVEARDNAETTIGNTKNVSNGFAGNVLGELRQLREGQQEIASTLARHMEWHLEQEGKK